MGPLPPRYQGQTGLQLWQWMDEVAVFADNREISQEPGACVYLVRLLTRKHEVFSHFWEDQLMNYYEDLCQKDYGMFVKIYGKTSTILLSTRCFLQFLLWWNLSKKQLNTNNNKKLCSPICCHLNSNKKKTRKKKKRVRSPSN